MPMCFQNEVGSMHALRLGRRNLFHACATSSFGKTLETFLTYPGVTGHGAGGEHEDNLRDGVLPFFFFVWGSLLYSISCNRYPETDTQLDHTPRKFRKMVWVEVGQRSWQRNHGCTLQMNLKLTFLLKLHAPESWLAVYYESFGQKNMAPEDKQSIPCIPWKNGGFEDDQGPSLLVWQE